MQTKNDGKATEAPWMVMAESKFDKGHYLNGTLPVIRLAGSDIIFCSLGDSKQAVLDTRKKVFDSLNSFEALNRVADLANEMRRLRESIRDDQTSLDAIADITELSEKDTAERRMFYGGEISRAKSALTTANIQLNDALDALTALQSRQDRKD